MPAKKLALFVDVEGLQQQLRSLHNRNLDLATLLEAARGLGEIVPVAAIADWSDQTPALVEACRTAGLRQVQLDRRGGRDGGRRRDAARGPVELELLAGMIEVLFPSGSGAEVDGFLLATCEDTAARAAALVRERFGKRVLGLGVEGAACEALRQSLDGWQALPMPLAEPEDPEHLARLVPLLEELERRKRYLNFKYIRETVVRRLGLPDRSFEAAEQLLSDAIACGLLVKGKIEDKYNPGQLFTAYYLNRESELFHRWGSGEPAPLQEEDAPAEREPSPPRGSSAPPAPARPQPARDPEPEPEPEPEEFEAEEYEAEPSLEDAPPVLPGQQAPGGEGRRKRRRRRGKGAAGAEAGPSSLAAGNPGRRGGGRNHQQDRVGRAYEAPSRFIYDEAAPRSLSDDEIDEDRILAARGDL